jgi:hypothetical protein
MHDTHGAPGQIALHALNPWDRAERITDHAFLGRAVHLGDSEGRLVQLARAGFVLR